MHWRGVCDSLEVINDATSHFEQMKRLFCFTQGDLVARNSSHACHWINIINLESIISQVCPLNSSWKSVSNLNFPCRLTFQSYSDIFLNTNKCHIHFHFHFSQLRTRAQICVCLCLFVCFRETEKITNNKNKQMAFSVSTRCDSILLCELDHVQWHCARCSFSAYCISSFWPTKIASWKLFLEYISTNSSSSSSMPHTTD